MVSRRCPEAKFRDLGHDSCERICLRRVLGELKIPSLEDVEVLCENQFTISITKNSVHYD